MNLKVKEPDILTTIYTGIKQTRIRYSGKKAGIQSWILSTCLSLIQGNDRFLDIQKYTESFEPELSRAIQRVVKGGCFLLGEEVSAFERE